VSLPPWLLLALVASLALALAYQLASQRFGWRIVAYWSLILVGLLAAEVVSELLDWNLTRFGDLRVLPDLVGAALMVFVLWFLGF
jgi:hypothetical protein